MKRTYTVSMDKNSGLWYAHQVGFPYIPCMISERSTFGNKNYALHNAAIMMGLTYKEYMKLKG